MLKFFATFIGIIIVLFLSYLGNPTFGIMLQAKQTTLPQTSNQQITDYKSDTMLTKASFYGFHLDLESADSVNGSNHPRATDLPSMSAHFWGIPEFEIHN